ncbi:MAG TPA: acyl-CoA synthetase FdrA [Chloroflexota bacterium]|jgi:FdrA protein
MVVRARIEKDTYADSVRLMQIAQALRGMPGVQAADVLMGTAANQESLRVGGLLAEEAERAGPSDLLLCVRAADAAAAASALDAALALLRGQGAAPRFGEAAPRSLRAAIAGAPAANLAVVSVPGAYAALEAEEALRAGLHVFLFSDNVPLDAEVRLKTLADERELLLMGPDCGTSIIGGVGLGFANAVRPGRVGIVGASGTGIQQVSCLLDEAGVGVSQAIGTGGRDLAEAVGGRTTRRALALLAADPATRVLVLVSKPPSPPVARAVLAAAAAGGKPVVACLLGAAPGELPAGVTWARTLAEAADAAAALAVGRPAAAGEAVPGAPATAGAGTSLRGLFAGGTLAQEALLLLRERLGAVGSNLDGSEPGSAPHLVIDYGDDEYTRGRPHPMIDNGLRTEALAAAARDAAVGVVLLDVVLGYGAHPDPAGELAPAIERARTTARAAGRALAVVVSLCGTAGDPQGLAAQRRRLEAAGAEVHTRNAAAAVAAAARARGGHAPEVSR